MNHPKIEAVDFGSNCRFGVCFLHLICFWFYVYLSLVFRAYYHWYICLLIWLLSSFFFVYIYIFPFSTFVSVYVYASLCDFVCIALLLPFVLGFCLSVFFFSFFFFLSVVFKHLLSLVDLFFGLVALFFISFFLLLFYIFIFKNIYNFNSFIFFFLSFFLSSFFLSFFFSTFCSEPCG